MVRAFALVPTSTAAAAAAIALLLLSPADVAVAAFSTDDATVSAELLTYGEMLEPMSRELTPMDTAKCLQLKDFIVLNANLMNMRNASTTTTKKAFPAAASVPATCSLVMPCAGAMYEPGKPITKLEKGKAFELKWQLATPQAGELQINLVKNPTNSSEGDHPQESPLRTLKQLKTEPREDSAVVETTDVEIPADVHDCDAVGACALQWKWVAATNSNVALHSCADIELGAAASSSSAASPSELGGEASGANA